jgi:predicted GNAT family acetyltransferase
VSAAVHPLDRAVWSALDGRHAALALGDTQARRYQPDISPFAAVADASAESAAALSEFVMLHGPAAFLQPGEPQPPPGTVVLKSSLGVQMVAEDVSPPEDVCSVERLGPADWPEMLALATLTEPGPFLGRTPMMGEFHGIREDGRLIAMAGERLKPVGYTEVSAVCTHPDARGRGFASLLSRFVADRIRARGETPFLHAYASNHRAIGLYEALGFRHRTHVTLTIFGPA